MSDCKGCFIKKECDAYIMDSHIDLCPCRNCLIKMVCKLDVCKDYGNFIRTIYHNEQFIEKMRVNNREMRISEKLNILREASK